MPNNTLSISDDDLCSRCARCSYKPGELSICTANFPGTTDDDDYIDKCAEFKPIGDSSTEVSCPGGE